MTGNPLSADIRDVAAALDKIRENRAKNFNVNPGQINSDGMRSRNSLFQKRTG